MATVKTYKTQVIRREGDIKVGLFANWCADECIKSTVNEDV